MAKIPSILHQPPPNYPDIIKVLPTVKYRSNAVFTYSPHIYFPAGGTLDQPLIDHEETHIKQQLEAGGPQLWWERYLKDPEFRLQQELEAYKVQLKSAQAYGRGYRRALLSKICADLASSMYGKLISKAEAKKELTNA